MSLLIGCLLLAAAGDPVGRLAPPLALSRWVHSPPLEISDLRGKVVLIRWFTDGCSLCEATAPALRELQRKYGARGLRLIGVFHPKPPGDPSLERARRTAERLGLDSPVALDADWKALRRWWLDAAPRDFTSVSFLVDKKGVIRYVHRGGEFHEGATGHESCRRDYRDIERTIEKLLGE